MFSKIKTEENEQLKQLKDYPNYAVSDRGNVYNIDTGTSVRQYMEYDNGKRKKLTVRLKDCNGHSQTVSVHRLVASAFIGDITDKVVHHWNGVGIDNRVANLEIMTKEEHDSWHNAKWYADRYAIEHGAVDNKYITKFFCGTKKEQRERMRKAAEK